MSGQGERATPKGKRKRPQLTGERSRIGLYADVWADPAMTPSEAARLAVELGYFETVPQALEKIHAVRGLPAPDTPDSESEQ